MGGEGRGRAPGEKGIGVRAFLVAFPAPPLQRKILGGGTPYQQWFFTFFGA